MDEIYTAIHTLKRRKAPGPDGIPYTAWKKIPELAASVLFDVALFMQQQDSIHPVSGVRLDLFEDPGPGDRKDHFAEFKSEFKINLISINPNHTGGAGDPTPVFGSL